MLRLVQNVPELGDNSSCPKSISPFTRIKKTNPLKKKPFFLKHYLVKNEKKKNKISTVVTLM